MGAFKLRALGFGLAALSILADQASKLAILDLFQADQTRHIEVAKAGPLGFDLVLWWNRGISFGLLHLPNDLMPYLLSGVAALVCLGLSVWLWRGAGRDDLTGWRAAALGLIIGGALGNVIDRLAYGAVVDFLYTYWNSHYWPAFNIGDSCICVGVAILLVCGIKPRPVGRPVGKPPEIA